MTRQRTPEADVDGGSPHLAVRDVDREAVAEMLADMLIAALEREGEQQA
jgi:hypothetical protein